TGDMATGDATSRTPNQVTSNTELGLFLRSRRACVTPAEVGLPAGGRRRVPGLRREEGAVLANVGTTWYTWGEQGRSVQPSATVLESIADALLLSRAERAHCSVSPATPPRPTTPGSRPSRTGCGRCWTSWRPCPPW